MTRKIIPALTTFTVILFFYSFECIAVGMGPPMGPGMGMGPPCWPPPCNIPIDGGLGFLVVSGIALAGKKLHSLRKQNPA